jgi:multidrug efflux pump subunit AcrA (membrane-fusion protein)
MFRIDGSGGAHVYIVQPSGVIRIVPVRLGIETAQQMEVRSGDLKDGDSVVVGSRSGLKEGSKVQTKVISLAGVMAPKS